MARDRLGSRLGFILLSAGCAIGVGNVWKFPWMVGQYGGGAFVLVYVFLHQLIQYEHVPYCLMHYELLFFHRMALDQKCKLFLIFEHRDHIFLPF